MRLLLAVAALLACSSAYAEGAQTYRPRFDPAPGTYPTTRTVRVWSPTPNSDIYCTTDGSTPTTASTKYTYPFTVRTTATLRCVAKAWNRPVSRVASGSFLIQGSAAPVYLVGNATASGRAAGSATALSITGQTLLAAAAGGAASAGAVTMSISGAASVLVGAAGGAASGSAVLVGTENNIGTNLNWVYDWDPGRLSADLVWSARPWAVGDGNGATVSNWVGTYAGTSLDLKGWPVVPTNTTFGAVFEQNPWVGVYKLSFKNKGGTTGDTVSSYSGNITLTNRSHNAGTNVTTYDVTVPSYASQFIWLRWAGTTGGIEDVSLMRPLKDASGWHAVGTPLSDHVIDRLTWFSTIRTMQTGGGSGTGLTGGTDTTWSGRTKPWSVQTRSSDAGRVGGVALENLIAMANQAGKHLWVVIPFRADADYILKMAQTIRYGSDGTTPYSSVQTSPVFAPLNSDLNVYVEHGNEIWNSGYGYPANENYALNQAEIAAGDPNRTTYTTSDSGTWGYSWRRVGWLAVRHSLIFRGVFGDAAMMTRVRPVLATQHGRYATTSEPLNYISNVWGTASSYDTINGVTNPKQPVAYYLYALATAPYTPDDNSGLTVTSAATLISGTLANLAQTAAGKTLPAMTWNHDTAATHGIGYVAYEGGNNLIPSLMPGGATAATIQAAKDASYDPTLGAAMGAAITGGVPDASQTGYVYGTLLKEWGARGGGLFMHYTLSQSAGSGSMFGLCAPSSQSGSDCRLETGPRWDAVKAFRFQ